VENAGACCLRRNTRSPDVRWHLSQCLGAQAVFVRVLGSITWISISLPGGVPQRLDRLPRGAYSRVHAARRTVPALSPLAPGQRRVQSEHKAGERLRLLLLQLGI